MNPAPCGGDSRSSRRAVSVNTIKNRISAGHLSVTLPCMYMKGWEDLKSALLGFISVIDAVNMGGLYQGDV